MAEYLPQPGFKLLKRALFFSKVTILTILVLAKFNFNPGNLYGAVQETYGVEMLNPGGLVKGPVEALSLGLALMLGLLGLPHILMRFLLFLMLKKRENLLYMAAPMLSQLLGGTPFLGFIAAVAFATILAVVAGLTLAASAALGNDLYVSTFKKGNVTESEKLKAAKMSTLMVLLPLPLVLLFKVEFCIFGCTCLFNCRKC